MTVNASFVSPTADAKAAHMAASFDANGFVSLLMNNLSGWRLVLTLLALAIAYDQCMSCPPATANSGPANCC